MRDPCREPLRRAWMHRAAGWAAAATGGAWAQPVLSTPAEAFSDPGTPVPPVEVLHWWASASERLAVDALTQLVNHPQHLWRHAVVPGGTSAGALTVLRARLLGPVKSAPEYRFYALAGGPVKRPGMVRVSEGGGAIDMEVWEVPAEHFGSFVDGIPSPLGIGKVRLADGSWVSGFVCEAAGLEGATDITHLGSWRAWLAAA